MENLSEFEEEPKSRSTLLTVLCILTFVGSGWTILSSAWAYSSAAKTEQMISSVRRQNINDSTSRQDSTVGKEHKRKSEFGFKMMSTMSKMMTADNIRKSAIGAIISALFTLLGAILMWNLRRTGFCLYYSRHSCRNLRSVCTVRKQYDGRWLVVFFQLFWFAFHCAVCIEFKKHAVIKF